MNKTIIASSFISLCFFVSCAPKASSQIDQASTNITDSLGCADSQSKVFDAFYTLLDETQKIPLASDMKKSLKNKIAFLQSQKNISADEAKNLDLISEKFSSVIDLMLSESIKNPKTTVVEQIQHMIEYEMQSNSSDDISETQKKINTALNEIHRLSSHLSKSLSSTCTKPTDTTSIAAAINSKVGMSKGLDMVFATAYQSCRVLDLPDMDETTPSTQGIKITGYYDSSHEGLVRVVSDLPALQKTHYYIKNIADQSSCFSVRNHPLIYDYGGKAALTNGQLNFFKNSGGPSPVLGLDCSGFISAAVVVSGLLYKPSLPNKPIYSYGVSNFMNAEKNNWPCFENVTVTPKSTIKPGDIVSVNGHVVAIDKMGTDPFGLNMVRDVSGCNSLDYRNFDFTVVQSDPSKGGIGINKFKARVYLSSPGKMRNAFVGMGQTACLAKFQNKNIKPSNTEWGFIRHKGTPECVAPRVTMVGEACTQACLQ